MVQSTSLLNFSLEAIEQWSQITSVRFGDTGTSHRHGYLGSTSYSKVHSHNDFRHVDSEMVLFNAIEAAILDHAKKRSCWWQKNRERLCFSQEGALCYFAILALTTAPMDNLDLIGRVLCNRDLLEFRLSYELDALIRSAFIFLDGEAQDAVCTAVQTLFETPVSDYATCFWKLQRRAGYVSAIPCHLRSAEAQAILDLYETTFGTIVQEPSIGMRGGIITAPFSYEVFLRVSDSGVIHLLSLYAGPSEGFGDFLVGGEREVGWQLREASSRHPSRFLKLLSKEWANISALFSDDIMDGAASYLAHRHGNLRPNNDWDPVEEPDASVLVNQVLDELERHLYHWRLSSSTAKALESCANVVQDAQRAERLVFLAVGFGYLKEESTVSGDSVDLLTSGINMKGGNVADSLMILISNIQERGTALPELLLPALRLFASSEHSAIRAVIMRRLPYLQRQNPELGWELFLLAMQNPGGLLQYAEQCLYYAYHDHFRQIAPVLERARREGRGEDMETWGRIMALCAMAGQIDFADFLGDMNALSITEAWQGAASVWTHTGNIRQHREQCLSGIEAGLRVGGPHASAVARQVGNIFRETTPPTSIPVEFIQLCFSVFESDSETGYRLLTGFDEWLNATSQRDPEFALTATEIYLGYVSRTTQYFYDHEDQLVQLVTRLFAEAEELEESDHGAMLNRVVAVQDLLLSLGVDSVNEWLKAAERL